MSVKARLATAGLKLRKQSPTIMTVVGVAGIVAAGAFACYQTYKKLPKAIEDFKDNRESNEIAKKTFSESDYSEADYKRDVALTYFYLAKDLAKIYAPSISVAALGIYGIGKGHGIMLQRVANLASTLQLLQEAYNQKNELEKAAIGEKANESLNRSLEPSKKPVTDTRVHAALSPYAQIYDESSKCWDPDRDYNILYLKAQQNLANDLLKSRGHVFLNEVYDMLGLDRTPAGAVVGWTKFGDGDKFIDFGMDFWENDPNDPDHVPGRWILDFNVDGVIYELI